MPAIRQNKLIPLMVIVALIVVGFIFWRVSRDGETTTPAGTPLTVVPAIAEPVSESQTGFLSGAKSVRTTTAADADTPTETIRTLTSEVSAMSSDMQKVADENRKLNGQVNQLQFNKEQLKGEIKSELQASLPAPTAPVSPAPADGKTPGSGTESIFEKNPLLGQLPSGFGFDKSAAGAPANGEAWLNPGCRTRVVRGGSWSSGPAQCRSAWRTPAPVDTTNAHIGFRLVRDL